MYHRNKAEPRCRFYALSNQITAIVGTKSTGNRENEFDYIS